MHFQQDRTQLSINKAVFIFWRFYAGYRLPLVGITGAALALVMALAYHSYGNAVRQAALSDAARLSKSSETAIVPMSGLTPPKENLTEFRSSHLLAILEEGASAADIKLDEITFVIDTSPNQPYVRYRASFQVLSRYPNFVAEPK